MAIVQTGVPTKIAMRDVELVIPDGLLRVRFLEGTVESLVAGKSPVIDDPKAYRIAVDRAEVAVDLQTLNQLMSASHSTTGKRSPLQSADFTTDAGLLVITGTKPVPFVMRGAVGVDSAGKMTVTVRDLKALGVETAGILDALDLKLADLVDVTNERGIRIDGNVVRVDPLVNMPAPNVDAKITGVSVESDGLVLRLGDAGTSNPETPSATSARTAADTEGTVTNFVSYRGGTVEQGRLTIHDTEILLLDLDSTDPLRLAIESVNKQIAAGYVRISEPGALTIFIPDADQLGVAIPPPTTATF